MGFFKEWAAEIVIGALLMVAIFLTIVHYTRKYDAAVSVVATQQYADKKEDKINAVENQVDGAVTRQHYADQLRHDRY